MTKEWKYVSNGKDLPELYDLKNDPEEFVNLAGEEGYAEIESTLKSKLQKRFR